MNKNSIGMMVAISLLSLSAYATDDEGHHKTSLNANIVVENNRHAEDLKTVNGSIRIGSFAEVNLAKTVNGSIWLGDDARASQLETVNGHVTIAARGVVSGDAMTVNGKVFVGEDASVKGTAKTVNGELRLAPRAQVGQIKTFLGNITLQDNARVERGILVARPKGSNSHWPDDPPVVTIGPGAEVNGELVFEHPVKLRVHSTAKIGTVTGAVVERF
jgi:hypothetical protein